VIKTILTMKKLLIITTLSLMSVGSLTSFVTTQSEIQNDQNCQYGRCIKIKKDGYRCKNCSQEGSSYCWSHRSRY
jgi:hypothetical protein